MTTTIIIVAGAVGVLLAAARPRVWRVHPLTGRWTSRPRWLITRDVRRAGRRGSA